MGLLIAVLLIAVGVPGAVWGYPWMSARVLMYRALHGTDAAERADALVHLGRERVRQATNVLLEALRTDEDPGVREVAAYALHKIRAPEAAAAIAETVDREPDTIHRAKMVVYLARISGRTFLDELQTWSADSAVWRSTGAALARIELADPTAAALLFDRLAGEDRFLAGHITAELRPILETMMEMIGDHVDLTAEPGDRWSAEQLAQVRVWWARHEQATGKLLADIAVQYIARRGIRRQLERLAGARRRAVFYLGLN